MNEKTRRVLSRLADIGFALARPWYWISNNKTDRFLDEYIKKVIREDLVVDIGRYRAVTKQGVEIWIGNYPYAFGSLKPVGYYLPYRRTRAKLRDYISKKTYESLDKGTE